MSESLTVLVGIHEDTDMTFERKHLAEHITAHKFFVKPVKVYWPRDYFVRSDKKYVVCRQHGACGEGGAIHVGSEYVLVSEQLFNRRDFPWTKEDAQKNEEEIKKRIKEHYPNKRIHIVPVGRSQNNEIGREINGILYAKLFRHIDITTLLVPSRKLLIIDENFYDNKYCTIRKDDPFKKFRQIAVQENLTLELFKPSMKESFLYYPLNCLILPTQETGEVVVVNGYVPSLVSLLKKYDLQIITVNMSESPKLGGSIRCCTNVYDYSRPLSQLLDLYDEH